MFCARITFFVFLLTLASLTEARAQSKLESDYDLVKTVNASRARYRASLEKLRAHYLKVGNREKASWVAEELRAFHRAPKQAYRLDLDVPSKELRAKKNDVRANQLYLMAMRYKDQGWGTDYGDNQRRAEILLRQLLTWYPESDKIGDAAYQLGDI